MLTKAFSGSFLGLLSWALFQYPKRRLIARSWNREIRSLIYRIALKFDRHLGSTAADVPVKLKSDQTILNTNLVVSRLCEILQ